MSRKIFTTGKCLQQENVYACQARLEMSPFCILVLCFGGVVLVWVLALSGRFCERPADFFEPFVPVKRPVPERWECGNLAFLRDFQGAVGRVGSPVLAFEAFRRSVISTALFHGVHQRKVWDAPRTAPPSRC
jgi:hypothetical protein